MNLRRTSAIPFEGKYASNFRVNTANRPFAMPLETRCFGPAVIGGSPSEPSPSKFQGEPGAAPSAAADLQGAMMSVHYPLHDR